MALWYNPPALHIVLHLRSKLLRAPPVQHFSCRLVAAMDPHAPSLDAQNGFAEGGAHDVIPDIVIGRLPVYLRTLKLLVERGQEVTSSQELGSLLGISSAQIRKDLSHFGEFGKQGTGYHIPYLRKQLEKILKVDCIWPVILVGAGNLGHALVSYNGFEQRGFRIVALFDNDPEKVGLQLGPVVVQPLEEIPATIDATHSQIAILAVPAAAAQQVADLLIASGIHSILCYAPITLSVPPAVRVQYIDPVIHFQHMTFYLKKGCIADSAT